MLPQIGASLREGKRVVRPDSIGMALDVLGKYSAVVSVDAGWRIRLIRRTPGV